MKVKRYWFGRVLEWVEGIEEELEIRGFWVVNFLWEEFVWVFFKEDIEFFVKDDFRFW